MRRRPFLPIVLLAILPASLAAGPSAALHELVPPLIAGFDPDDGLYTIELIGAWDKATLRVVDATLTYGTHVEQAVLDWQRAFQTAGVPMTLEYKRLVPGGCTPPSCQAGPESGEAAGSGPASDSDIFVTDAALLGGWCLGCDVDGTLHGGKYASPMLVTVPALYGGGFALMGPNDLYNYALHELGHATALGHAEPDGDAMHVGWPANVRNCVTTLDLHGLGVAYAFLPGPWKKPPPEASVPVATHGCAF